MTFQRAVRSPFLPIFHLKVAICMCRSRLATCESALERFAALVFEQKISSFSQLFFCQIFPWFCSKRRFFLQNFDISNPIKMEILPCFHQKVAICMCRSRLETCESALERFNALVFGNKISRFSQLFLCEILP